MASGSSRAAQTARDLTIASSATAKNRAFSDGVHRLVRGSGCSQDRLALRQLLNDTLNIVNLPSYCFCISLISSLEPFSVTLWDLAIWAQLWPDLCRATMALN